MLKWLLLVVLVGIAYGHPGVYDEYSYSEEKDKGDDDDYYLYYDEDEEDEDINDDELKKILDIIAKYPDEDDTPQKGKKGPKKNKPGKQRTKRSTSLEDLIPRTNGAVEMTNRKATKKHRDAAADLANNRSKRGILGKLFPVIVVKNQHPRPLTKEQRDKVEGGFFGWQYAILNEDCCSCKEDNTCSCCPSTNLTGSDCVKFVAQPNRAQVSLDIGAHRHMEITVAKNSRSMSCENVSLKDVCIYSDSFASSGDGYKACVIITNNVKDPKAGVLKCINYSNGKSNISDS